MKNMKNFLIKSLISGRKSELSGGPTHDDGKMSTTLYVNDNGALTRVVELICIPKKDGILEVRVEDYDGEYITINVNKNKEEKIVIKSFFKRKIQEIIDDKSITPTQRLKKIQMLIE